MIPSEYRDILYVSELPLDWPPPAVKVERSKKTSVLLLKRTFFSNVQIWRLIFLNPVGVKRRTVSHFKGVFKTFKMRYSTFLYWNWIGLHVHFKKAISHLKMAKGIHIFFRDCMFITFIKKLNLAWFQRLFTLLNASRDLHCKRRGLLFRNSV